MNIFHKIVAKAKLLKEYKDSIFLFAITFAVYLHNLSPSSYAGDSGDILSAIVTTGVPHPSGYPLVTLLGVIFNKILPSFLSPAWKAGVITSVIPSSISVVLIYLIIRELTKERFISMASALILAFTFPFWLYAEVVEVMAIYYLFLIAIIYTTIRYIKSLDNKFLYWTSFLIGLSLTNNESVVLILPAVFLSILLTNRKIVLNFKLILKCFVFLLTGLIPYIYIPLAASHNPAINTGMVVNFKNFIDLITRKHYGWGLGSLDEPKNYFASLVSAYINYYIIYLNAVILIFSLLGLIYAIKKLNLKIILLLFLSFVLLGPFYFYYANLSLYNIGNFASFEKFFIPSIIITIIFVPLGIIFIRDVGKKYLKNKTYTTAINASATSIVVIFPLIFFIINFYKTNFRNIYLGDNLARDAIGKLEKNSVVLIQDDTVAYNILYVKNSYNFRKDLIIPSMGDGFEIILKAKGLNDKEIYQYKIEHANALQDSDLFHSTISNLVENNLVYTDWTENLVSNKNGRMLFVPYGIVYQMIYEKDFNLTEEEYLAKLDSIIDEYHINDLIKYKSLISEQLFLTHIRKCYSFRLLEVARFISERYNDTNAANKYSNIAFEIDPSLKTEN